jgi:hypothetical protein
MYTPDEMSASFTYCAIRTQGMLNVWVPVFVCVYIVMLTSVPSNVHD